MPEMRRSALIPIDVTHTRSTFSLIFPLFGSSEEKKFHCFKKLKYETKLIFKMYHSPIQRGY